MINFKRGSVWTGTLVVDSNGTVSAPVTYQAYGTGARPIIQRATSHPGHDWSVDIQVTGDWNVIKDFMLRHADHAGVHVMAGADRNVISDLEATVVGIGVLVAGQFNLVTRNTIYNLRMVVNTNDGAPPGNDDDFGATCIWIEGNNNKVSYNRGTDCRAPSFDYGEDGGFVECWANCDNLSVHHNWAERTVGFIELGAPGGGSAANVTIHHNVMYNQGAGVGFFLTNVCLGGIPVTNMKFEHNTFYLQSSDGYRVFGCRADLAPLTLRNNIFYSNIQIANSAPGVHTNNLYHMANMVNGSGVGYTLGTGENTGNPLFVNSGVGDLHLQSTSPAINAGANLGYTKDFEDHTIPQGSAPDLGAYEYASTASSPTPSPTPPPTSMSAPLT